MEFWIRTIGALVVTYVLSRILIKAASGLGWRQFWVIATAHLASFFLIFAFVGWLRAYWSPFEPDAVLPYIVPQIVWLALDLARRK